MVQDYCMRLLSLEELSQIEQCLCRPAMACRRLASWTMTPGKASWGPKPSRATLTTCSARVRMTSTCWGTRGCGCWVSSGGLVPLAPTDQSPLDSGSELLQLPRLPSQACCVGLVQWCNAMILRRSAGEPPARYSVVQSCEVDAVLWVSLHLNSQGGCI